jgi:hypothetical protein
MRIALPMTALRRSDHGAYDGPRLRRLEGHDMGNGAAGFAMDGDATDGRLMNYVVRMVVPMRREFGRNLNVVRFLHDAEYAHEVLDEALRSGDARLLEYARYVELRLSGLRIADAAQAPVDASPAAGATPARVAQKYVGGLR